MYGFKNRTIAFLQTSLPKMTLLHHKQYLHTWLRRLVQFLTSTTGKSFRIDRKYNSNNHCTGVTVSKTSYLKQPLGSVTSLFEPTTELSEFPQQ